MKKIKRALIGAMILALLSTPALAADAKSKKNRCVNGRSKQAALWLSIAHPGMGEFYLKGWGAWSKMPQQKFWFGWIPLYGMPGYLQAKSADDAFHCRTNDRLKYNDAETRAASRTTTASR